MQLLPGNSGFLCFLPGAPQDVLHCCSPQPPSQRQDPGGSLEASMGWVRGSLMFPCSLSQPHVLTQPITGWGHTPAPLERIKAPGCWTLLADSLARGGRTEGRERE